MAGGGKSGWAVGITEMEKLRGGGGGGGGGGCSSNEVCQILSPFPAASQPFLSCQTWASKITSTDPRSPVVEQEAYHSVRDFPLLPRKPPNVHPHRILHIFDPAAPTGEEG